MVFEGNCSEGWTLSKGNELIATGKQKHSWKKSSVKEVLFLSGGASRQTYALSNLRLTMKEREVQYLDISQADVDMLALKWATLPQQLQENISEQVQEAVAQGNPSLPILNAYWTCVAAPDLQKFSATDYGEYTSEYLDRNLRDLSGPQRSLEHIKKGPGICRDERAFDFVDLDDCDIGDQVSPEIYARIQSLISQRGQNGFGCLHAAVHKGSPRIIELLDAYGADLDDSNDAGWTPLHEAALHGFVEIGEALLRLGAKIDAQATVFDCYQWTPLFVAVWANQPEMVRFLLRRANPWRVDNGFLRQSVTHVAVGRSIEALEILLDHDQRLSLARDSRGDTPLHRAASMGYAQSIELLLRYGAPVDAQNLVKSTPLHLAWISFATANETSALLISKLSLPGWDPLRGDSTYMDERLLSREILLKHGASTNIKNIWEATPSQGAFRAVLVTLNGKFSPFIGTERVYFSDAWTDSLATWETLDGYPFIRWLS
jgi:ankyrin repeat protein